MIHLPFQIVNISFCWIGQVKKRNNSLIEEHIFFCIDANLTYHTYCVMIKQKSQYKDLEQRWEFNIMFQKYCDLGRALNPHFFKMSTFFVLPWYASFSSTTSFLVTYSSYMCTVYRNIHDSPYTWTRGTLSSYLQNIQHLIFIDTIPTWMKKSFNI